MHKTSVHERHPIVFVQANDARLDLLSHILPELVSPLRWILKESAIVYGMESTNVTSCITEHCIASEASGVTAVIYHPYL